MAFFDNYSLFEFMKRIAPKKFYHTCLSFIGWLRISADVAIIHGRGHFRFPVWSPILFGLIWF